MGLFFIHLKNFLPPFANVVRGPPRPLQLTAHLCVDDLHKLGLERSAAYSKNGYHQKSAKKSLSTTREEREN
jgi:hypothetical protein